MRVRLKWFNLVITAAWVPVGVAVFWKLRLLGHWFVVVAFALGGLATVVVFLFPVTLLVAEGRVHGTWLWGRKDSWPLDRLALDAHGGLFFAAFGGRRARVDGRTVFVVWPPMENGDALIGVLELEPEARSDSLFSQF